MLRDVSLKAGALREQRAQQDSSRAQIDQLQQQVRLPDLPRACQFLPKLMLLSTVVFCLRL